VCVRAVAIRHDLRTLFCSTFVLFCCHHMRLQTFGFSTLLDGISPSLLQRQTSPSSSSDNGPARKRRRPTDPPHQVPPVPPPDATMEERRAARAQRNRIAAQASRDRRKDEHIVLRDRVQELEAECEMLRAVIGGTMAAPSPASSVLSAGSSSVTNDQWRRDIERENQELRAKIANLERLFAAASNPPLNVVPTNNSAVPTIPSSMPVAQPPVSLTFQTAPTRHSARVATDSPVESSLQRVGSSSPIPNPSSPQTPLSTGTPTGSSPSSQILASEPPLWHLDSHLPPFLRRKRLVRMNALFRRSRHPLWKQPHDRIRIRVVRTARR